jgi:phage-related minor tail protein
MATFEQNVAVNFTGNTKELQEASRTMEKELAELGKLADSFGKKFNDTIAAAIKNGRSFEQTLKSIGLELSNLALDAALEPLKPSTDTSGTGIWSQLMSLVLPPSQNAVTPNARGGVVNGSTLFATGSGLGMMGEAGPEAILPLTRGSDGRLGVAATGQGGSSPVNVTFNISTPDVEGFRKSEPQIAAMLTRTVSRGRRGL